MNFFGKSSYGLLQKVSKEKQTPKIITAKWKDTYDIISLDKTIKKFLITKEKENLSILEEEKRDYENQLNEAKSRVNQLSLKNQIEEISEKINILKNNLQNYIDETKSLLEEYQQNKNPLFIEYFLEKVKKFYPHQIFRSKQFDDQICPEHQVELENFDLNDDSEEKFCPICFRIFNVHENWEVYEQDKKRDHDILDNLEKIIDLVEGNDGFTIPLTLRKVFDEIVERKGWKKEDIDKKRMLQILKESNNPKLKPHISKILYEYCGIIPPNLGKYRLEIREDSILYCQAFKEEEKIRNSALNCYWVLFKIIQRRNYDLNLDEFRHEISDNTKEEYFKIWRKICKKNNWEFMLD